MAVGIAIFLTIKSAIASGFDRKARSSGGVGASAKAESPVKNTTKKPRAPF